MPGALVTGRWHPELEASLLETVREFRKKDPLSPLVIAVGSITLSRYLRRAIATEIGSTAGIHVLLLYDIARRLSVMDTAARELPPFPGLASVPLVRAVCDAHSELEYFKPMQGKRGFSRALASTFEDLGESGIAPESLARAAESRKLEESFSLFAATREKMGSYCDAGALYGTAAAAARLYEAHFGTRRLLLYGFYDFTELQRRLLEALAQSTEPIIFFPHEESPDYEYVQKSLRWFRSLGLGEKRLPAAGKHFVPQRPVGPLSQGGKSTEDAEGKDGHAVKVHVISAPGKWREAREITRRLLAHATQGVPFHRMAILLRDPGSYLDLFLEAFTEANVPSDLAIGTPLAKTRAGRSLLLLLEILDSDLPRPLVASFLSTAPLDHSTLFGVPLESPMLMDIVSREAGIVKGETDWKERLAIAEGKARAAARRRAEEGDAGAEANRRLEAAKASACTTLLALVRLLGELRERLGASRSWSDFAEFCRWILTGMFSPTEDTDGLLGAVARLSDLDGIVPSPSLAAAREVTAELLEARSGRPSSRGGGGVLVTDLMGVRGVSLDVVVIPGLIEGVFPATPRQDPILLDRERDAIRETLTGAPEAGSAAHGHPNALADFILPPKWTRVREEKLLFSLAVHSARAHLVLSYPRIDPRTAKPLLPSYLLLRFIEQLEGKSITFENLEDAGCIERVALFPLAPQEGEIFLGAAEYDMNEVRCALDERNGERIRYLAGLTSCFRRSLARHDARWSQRVFTPFEGVLSSEKLSPEARKALALSGGIVSARRLEKYAACPFEYFVEEVLGLIKLEEPEEEMALDPMKRGILYHTVLEKIVPLAVDLTASKLPPGKRVKEYEEVIEHCLADFAREESTGVPLIWEIEKERLREDLAKYLEKLTAELETWEPRFFEKSFGWDGVGCLEYTVPGCGTLLVRGRIDRIDVSRKGGGYRIVDYKTGKQVIKKDNDFKQGECLQLAFYLLASARVLALGNVGEGIASYDYVTRRGEYKRVSVSGSEWETLGKDFDVILETITKGISSGIFPSWRADAYGRCRYCEAQPMCASGAERIFERKQEDPRVRAFRAMKECRKKP